ncbi:MAG: Acetyltransferase domain [Chlamydiota bacterium]|jgi:GNAT superfamily N-acetyltransferase
MSIATIVREESHARRELVKMAHDHEWFCTAASEAILEFQKFPWSDTTQSQSRLGARLAIVEVICGDFTQLQERPQSDTPLPVGHVICQISDIGRIASCLDTWRRGSMQEPIASSFYFNLTQGILTDCRIYGYEIDNKIVGLICMNPSCQDFDQKLAWLIEYLIVDPSKRKLGIGSRLVRKIEQEARAKIILKPVLNALPFYKKLGFYLNIGAWMRKQGLSMHKITAPLIDEE